MAQENGLTFLPDALQGARDSLKVLELSRNSLKSLPESIGALHYLQTVNLSYNELGTFPSDPSQGRNLPHPHALESIPHAMCQCQSLTSLDISRNQLTEIPPWFSSFAELRVLQVSHNRLRCVVRSVFPCKTHTFRTVTHTISMLPNLAHLDLSMNQIANLPSSMVRMPSAVTFL